MATLIRKIKDTAGTTHNILSDRTLYYCTCSTGASTVAKVVTDINADFVLETGAIIYVSFTYSNTATNPTLTLKNGTTTIVSAKSLKQYGTTSVGSTSATSWKAGAVVCFIYDGTNWVESTGIDSNTTYTQKYFHPSFSGSSATSSANSGTAISAVTGYASFSGGSGSLTSNTTSTNGIAYIEQVSFSSGVLTLGTKYLHHSHSGASLGTASTESVAPSGHTHNVTATGTVSLGSNTTSTDGVPYRE